MSGEGAGAFTAMIFRLLNLSFEVFVIFHTIHFRELYVYLSSTGALRIYK